MFILCKYFKKKKLSEMIFAYYVELVADFLDSTYIFWTQK